VAVGGFGEHHACDEGAERDRQVERMHDRRCADHSEQAGDDEQLALSQPADEPEERVQREPADDHERYHREDRVERELPARRSAGIRRHPGHRRDDRDHRNDREVLEQKDGEGPLALWRVKLVVRAQHRQHLRGR
jgi:hypothetical protein